MAAVAAQAGHVADAVGTEHVDDVVGPTVVEGLGVRGDGRADAGRDVGESELAAPGSRRVRCFHRTGQSPSSTTGISSGFTLTFRSAGSSLS